MTASVVCQRLHPPLFVGEQNPYGWSNPKFALYPDPPGSAGGRLCRLVCGLGEDDYVRLTARVNLCSEPWSRAVAERAALNIHRSEVRREVIVLLGAKVCAAFDFVYLPFEAPLSGGKRYLILPHPSGRSRGWNSPNAYLRARALLRKLCPSVPWGSR